MSPSNSPQNVQPFMVDFTALEYVGSFDHNLMCAICHSPFLHPVKVDCGHVFCGNCISQAWDHQNLDNQTCPTCRGKTSEISTVPVPKILEQILEELVVKCPLSSQGCISEIPRGSVQDHINQYCGYVVIECPFDNDCSEPVQRRYLWEDKWQNRCLHNFVQCGSCGDMVMELEQITHLEKHDSERQISCSGCMIRLRNGDLEKHNLSCPQAVIPCLAAPYGCDFASKRILMAHHTQNCPLAKLTPFLKLQNERLSAHEAALKHLRHKNSLLETSLHNLQESLNVSAELFERPTTGNSCSNNPDSPPFDSASHHLLCLHESLREEVARVAAALSDIDAKASMTVMNETLRVKEELSHTNAAVSSIRMQLHWLMSARLQNQQQNQQHHQHHHQHHHQQQQQRLRAALTRGRSLEEGTDEGPNGSSGPEMLTDALLSSRRSSDSMRQDTKL